MFSLNPSGDKNRSRDVNFCSCPGSFLFSFTISLALAKSNHISKAIPQSIPPRGHPFSRNARNKMSFCISVARDRISLLSLRVSDRSSSRSNPARIHHRCSCSGRSRCSRLSVPGSRYSRKAESRIYGPFPWQLCSSPGTSLYRLLFCRPSSGPSRRRLLRRAYRYLHRSTMIFLPVIPVSAAGPPRIKSPAPLIMILLSSVN